MELHSHASVSVPAQDAPPLSQEGKEKSTLQRKNSRSRLQNIMRAIRRSWAGYLFLLPALATFLIFVWYPIVLGFVMSFQNVDMINPPAWVGWLNYQRVLSDPLFVIAWRNTFEFTIYALIFGYIIPVILALLINEMRHAKSFFRLAFYLPVMLPPIVTVFLWRWIYNPDAGLLNSLLALLHLPAGLWLENASTSLPSLVVVATWSAAGSTILIYLAALQGVSATLYEAAEIDGSNLWQRLWNITLPAIRPVMLLMLILQVISTMQVFVEPFTITSGGPQNSTMTILLLIYNYAFQQGEFGRASASGAILFLVLAVFSLIYMRITRNFMQGD
ncbi:carbohydrate ABC transporter permease [Dictyobacter arantiisoli]|uniref:Sugar ABC transporter permease n=1 Tax=Dictyobacter arantiisoli TaxID=2014874 RepID=A0A5A5T6N9_9CHLR|nr:sugar ABC transporter permease [Dictyobacter arantiisoli]GCF07038.1 sugar ABC transporter permease [Dictyobacter arantiisoli]